MMMSIIIIITIITEVIIIIIKVITISIVVVIVIIDLIAFCFSLHCSAVTTNNHDYSTGETTVSRAPRVTLHPP